MTVHLLATRCLFAPASRTWTVDATPPPIALTRIPNPSNDSTPTFDFDSTDSTDSFECAIDAGTFVTCTPPFTTS